MKTVLNKMNFKDIKELVNEKSEDITNVLKNEMSEKSKEQNKAEKLFILFYYSGHGVIVDGLQ